MRYWMYQYKRTWRGSITTSFLYPVLYLAAMGVGLGLAGRPARPHVDGVRYLDFIAPGLLAATAMQIGGNESMYPVMGAIKWMRTYFAMLATPLARDRRAPRPPGLDRRCAWPWSRRSTWRSWPPSARSTPPLALLALPAGIAHRAGLRGAHRRLRRDPGERHRLLHHLPVRAHPALLVLGDLLPRRPAPGLAAARRLGHPALPRGGAVPGARRWARWAGPGCGARRLPGGAAVGRLRARPALVPAEAGHVSAATRESLPRRVPLRITPPALLGSRRARRLVERNILVYRRGWIFFVSGFFEPLLLPAVHRPRPEQAWSATSTSTGRSSPTPPTWRPGCWPRRP